MSDVARVAVQEEHAPWMGVRHVPAMQPHAIGCLEAASSKTNPVDANCLRGNLSG